MNRRESIKRSIIKYWNVNYLTLSDVQCLEEEKTHEAQQVYNRLEREKEEDKAKQQAEIDQAYKVAELNDLAREREAAYNATTGSYSGTYGQGEVDSATRGRIDLILNEKSVAIRDIINVEKTE